ncbi:MAG: hypothetical protein EOP50_09740 [Sphingobacteriales bacterium]|nr:MAG: hypothetical protein EOP50_09740 [Sphingobacteriales bacterium]
MKNIFLLFLLALTGSAAFAQTDSERQTLQDSRTYYASSNTSQYVDAAPFFPGGSDKWSRYVNSSALVLNAGMEAAKQGLDEGFYNVTVRFAVHADGTVSEVRTIGKTPGYGLEDAALYLVENSGKWVPGTSDARSWLQLTIRFHVFE